MVWPHARQNRRDAVARLKGQAQPCAELCAKHLRHRNARRPAFGQQRDDAGGIRLVRGRLVFGQRARLP